MRAFESQPSFASGCGPEPQAYRLVRGFGIAVGCFALAVAVLVIAGGWGANVDSLKSVLSGFATMKVNTALAIGMLGAALVLAAMDAQYRAIVQPLAWMALLIGVVTLAEHAFRWDARIDEFLVRDRATAASAAPGRPAAATALMIALLGAALIAAGRPALGWLKTLTSAAASVIAWATLNVYVFGPQALREVPPFSSVALHTSILLMLLGLAVLGVRPVSRPVTIALACDSGGLVCRWLLPPAILAPPLLGSLLAHGQTLLSFPTPFGWALYSAISTLGSVWLVMTLAQRITSIDAERNAATDLSRRLREALNEREAFKAVIENSSDFIGIADPQGVPVYLNPAGRRMIGLDPDFPIERLQIADCYPPELRSFAADVILTEMRERDRWQGETFFRHFGSQQAIPVSDTHFMVRDSQTGRLLGSATITRDISAIRTARDRLETANRLLEEANLKLRRTSQEQRILSEAGAIFASTLDYEETLASVARLIAREFADHCFVVLVEESGEIRRMIVATRDASLDWACGILMHSKIDRSQPHLVARSLETWRPVVIESVPPDAIVAFAQNDPECLRALLALDPGSVLTAPLVARGRLLGALAFISSTRSRPFTSGDLQVAEALALRAALSIENARLYQAARHAIQARDEVLGIVAHDLRNPLNSIVMQAGLLRLQRAGENRCGPDSALAIHRSAMRMNRLIQDLLDIARVEAGRLTLKHDHVPTRHLLEDSVEAHRMLASSASIHLGLDAPDDVPDVWADRDRLLQIFENLVSNAVKFTPAEGRVTVAATSAESEIVFSVADTGIGISAEELPHVFDRFWQAKRGERRGAGLGLPIVKGIVDAHGGRLWLTSEPGRGTTFFFTIPMARRPAG